MKKNLKIALASTLLLLVNQLSAKIYYGLGSEKQKKKAYEFTIKQLDSEADFSVINSQKIGLSRSARHFFSPSGQYLVVYLTNKKKVASEMVVYSTNDLNEVMRVKVDKFATVFMGQHLAPIFNEDESVIALQVAKGKKQNFINAYNLNSGNLLYSIEFAKKGQLLGQSQSKNTFYIGGKSSTKGHAGLYVYNITDGDLLKTFKEKKVFYNYRSDLASDFFVKILSDQSTRQYAVFTLDPDTGKRLFKQKLGNTKPIFNKVNVDDNFFYMVNKSGSPKKISVSKFENNSLELLVSTDGELNPYHLTASHDGRKFIVASKSNMRLLDRDEPDNIFKMNAPFDVATGFFSDDDSLVYLREGTGSEVGIVDFTNRKLIGDSGTGRASVKFGQFMASVALAAATGGISGGSYISIAYYRSDTAMLLSRDQQKLYVVNAKTNDVTIFNAKDLSGKKGVATGKNTFGVFQLSEEYYPNLEDSNIIVFSPKSVSYFNSDSTEIINQVKFHEFLNLDFEENLFFAKSKDNTVQIYQMSTGKLINTVENSDKMVAISYQLKK
jgi:hypothetical protein